ncbi:putative amidoligase domain-containing protein [Paenibacillus lemnae]|uniref:Phage phiEco32-like COOH-NH2 ligase-type 2 n=1 Tax=Paenibacillus lemnae TaxID=1330551 RepID=A0A848MA54_PAELE|nr:hypothetical protein [Paenibacillus lemnae]NMO97081.1 hypothetical protein [Paenibacillus lemnae]
MVDSRLILPGKVQMTPAVMNARLRRSGIPSRLFRKADERMSGSTYTARYLISVRGLEHCQVDMLMAGSGWLKRPAVDHEDGLQTEVGLTQRLTKAAVRTLYALGQEEGEVVIALLPNRRYAVDEVRFHQDRSQRTDREANGDHAALILLGMDPEFVLVDSRGEITEASQYLERHGKAGCDAVREGDFVTYPLAELRPDPKSDPEALLHELRKTMIMAAERITDRSLAWKAGSMPAGGLPLGGHLHFSGVTLNLDILQVLDNYLALPLAALEDPSGRKRRPKYGSLGDYRRQPHGGFEYRTPPSFLVSPSITRAVVHMAYLIAREFRRLMSRPLSTERVHEAYYEGTKSILIQSAEALHQDYRRLPGYEYHASSIERLFRMISEGQTWDESRDIRRLWHIPVLP